MQLLLSTGRSEQRGGAPKTMVEEGGSTKKGWRRSINNRWLIEEERQMVDCDKIYCNR